MPKKPRSVCIKGDIALVPLTKGHFATIDLLDAEFVSQWNWCANGKKSNIYGKRGEKTNGKVVTIMLHRAIMGNPIGMEVDHIDGNVP